MITAKIVVIVSGGVVQEVFADDAEVYLIDFDQSGFDGGPRQWNVGRLGAAPLSALPAAVGEEIEESEAVRAVVEAVTGAG